MAAPHGRIEPGQPLETAISARAWNRAQDAADIVFGAGGGMGGGPAAGYEPVRNIIMARNITGEPVPRWGVLRIAGIEIDPSGGDDARRSFEGMPVIRGAQPNGAAAEKFVIAIDPIGQDKIGRVCAAGITQAKVDFSQSTHTRAGPKTGTNSVLALDSSDSGPASVLWSAGTSGVQWALIRFDDSARLRIGKYTGSSAWAKHTTATVAIWETGAPPNETSSHQEIRGVVNHWADVPSGKWVGIQSAENGLYYLVVAEC